MKDDLLDLADFGYQRLRTRLDGLTDDEYLWEPAPDCWSVRPAGDGTFRADSAALPPEPAPLTTIAWRLSHVIDLLAADRNATWLGLAPTGTPGTTPGRAEEAVAHLEQAYASFRDHLERAELAEKIGPVGGPYADSSRAAFVLHRLEWARYFRQEATARYLAGPRGT